MCARVDALHRDVTCVGHNALICALMPVLHASVSEAHEHETSTTGLIAGLFSLLIAIALKTSYDFFL